MAVTEEAMAEAMEAMDVTVIMEVSFCTFSQFNYVWLFLTSKLRWLRRVWSGIWRLRRIWR